MWPGTLVLFKLFKVKIILFNRIEMVVKICLFDEESDTNFWTKSFHCKMEIYINGSNLEGKIKWAMEL